MKNKIKGLDLLLNNDFTKPYVQIFNNINSIDKTNIIWNIIENLELTTLIFTRKKCKGAFIRDMLKNKMNISDNKFNTLDLSANEWQELSNIICKLAYKPIYTVSYDYKNISSIEQHCKSLKECKNLDLVIIDFSQYWYNSQKEYIKKRLVAIAEELNIAIILLNIEVENEKE